MKTQQQNAVRIPETGAVTLNTIPERRTGTYLMLFEVGGAIVAYGLSTSEAIRVQRYGAPFIPSYRAEALIERVSS